MAEGHPAGTVERSRKWSKKKSPKFQYMSCNMHDPGNLALKTGRRERGKAGREGRQAGKRPSSKDKREDEDWPSAHDRVKQITHASYAVPQDGVTIPDLARCWLKTRRISHQNPEPGEDLLSINCYSVTASRRGREIHLWSLALQFRSLP